MKKINLFIKLFVIALTVKSCGNVTNNETQKNETKQSLNYDKINIGDQIWMSVNLNVDRFRNGDLIPQAKTISEWKNANENKQAVWCYYNNDSIQGSKYGKLYNWYAINDSRGLTPIGWEIPNEVEWTKLISSLGGEQEAGDKIITDNDSSQSGFNAYISLYRCKNGKWSLDENEIDPVQAIWWSSDNSYCQLWWGKSSYFLNTVKIDPTEKACGFSVRCIKDFSKNPSSDGSPYEPKKGSNERKEILDIFRLDCSPQTKFKVEHFQICNDWACACVTPMENNVEIAEPRWRLFSRVNKSWQEVNWSQGLSLNDDFELIDLPKQNSRVARLIVEKYPNCPMVIFKK